MGFSESFNISVISFYSFCMIYRKASYEAEIPNFFLSEAGKKQEKNFESRCV